MIKHNVFYFENGSLKEFLQDTSFANCPVQSFKYEFGGNQFSSGVVLPGKYDFGEVTGSEEIEITLGMITINGVTYGVGQVAEIKKGSKNIWEVKGNPASYVCKFIND